MLKVKMNYFSFQDVDSEQVQIGFAKNGKFLDWAYRVQENELKGHSLFPHVLTKNVSFEVNMGQKVGHIYSIVFYILIF